MGRPDDRSPPTTREHVRCGFRLDDTGRLRELPDELPVIESARYVPAESMSLRDEAKKMKVGPAGCTACFEDVPLFQIRYARDRLPSDRFCVAGIVCRIRSIPAHGPPATRGRPGRPDRGVWDGPEHDSQP